MLGYIYLNEQDALNDQAICDAHFGYPKEGVLTEHWVGVYYHEEGGYWYIFHDESINGLIGEPIQLVV